MQSEFHDLPSKGTLMWPCNKVFNKIKFCEL